MREQRFYLPPGSFVDAAVGEKSAARIRRQIHGVPTADVVFDKFTSSSTRARPSMRCGGRNSSGPAP